MSQFFESIRVQDSKVYELEAHQERVNRSCLESSVDLETLAAQTNFPTKGLYKWRVSYGLEGLSQATLSSYTPKHPQEMSLEKADHIAYGHKYEDRTSITDLLRQSNSSDILMLKNGLITDSSYANLIFYNGKEWLTPKSPMLGGTQRSILLAKGNIVEADISIADLNNFSKFRRINALMPFETSPDLLISIIKNKEATKRSHL